MSTLVFDVPHGAVADAEPGDIGSLALLSPDVRLAGGLFLFSGYGPVPLVAWAQQTVTGTGALAGAAGVLSGVLSETLEVAVAVAGGSGALAATATETVEAAIALTGSSGELAGTLTETLEATVGLLGAAGLLAGTVTETIAGTVALLGAAGVLSGALVIVTSAPRGAVTLTVTSRAITATGTTGRGPITATV